MKNMMSKCMSGLAVATLMVSATGCLTNVVEPQKLTFPSPTQKLTVETLSAQLTIEQLPAEYQDKFNFSADQQFTSKEYAVEPSTVCYEHNNASWVMVYIIDGNGVLSMNNFKVPMTVGNAAFIPANQVVGLYNATEAPLKVIISTSAEYTLPENLDAEELDLTDVSTYNGVTASDTTAIINAQSYNEDDIKATIGTKRSVKESTSLDKVQTLSPEEAKAVDKDLNTLKNLK